MFSLSLKSVNIGFSEERAGSFGAPLEILVGGAAAELSAVSPRNKWGPAQPIVLQHRGLVQTVGLVLTCGSEAAIVRVSTGEMLISKNLKN